MPREVDARIRSIPLVEKRPDELLEPWRHHGHAVAQMESTGVRRDLKLVVLPHLGRDVLIDGPQQVAGTAGVAQDADGGHQALYRGAGVV